MRKIHVLHPGSELMSHVLVHTQIQYTLTSEFSQQYTKEVFHKIKGSFLQSNNGCLKWCECNKKLWLEDIHRAYICEDSLVKCKVGWLVVFNVPSTARSFRDGTPIYCPLRRTWSSVFTPIPTGNWTPGPCVAVHNTTTVPRQLHWSVKVMWLSLKPQSRHIP